jgi:hypothetical protein
MAPSNHDPADDPRQAGWWPVLRRHLGWVIAAKLGLLALLYLLFFSPPHRPDVDAEVMGRRLDSAPR